MLVGLLPHVSLPEPHYDALPGSQGQPHVLEPVDLFNLELGNDSAVFASLSALDASDFDDGIESRAPFLSGCRSALVRHVGRMILANRHSECDVAAVSSRFGCCWRPHRVMSHATSDQLPPMQTKEPKRAKYARTGSGDQLRGDEIRPKRPACTGNGSRLP
jgi:hypothetical protein